MRNSSKILLGFMLVMMICCVSAVSATDINGTDDAIITDDIAIDDVSEIVEEVEIDDASNDVVEEQNRGSVILPNINNQVYSRYFDTDGTLNDSSVTSLKFNGNFVSLGTPFGNFKITRTVTLDVTNATFTNIGFDLLADNLKLNNFTYTATSAATNVAAINVGSSSASITGVEVTGANIDIKTPSNTDYFAINVLNANYTKLLKNVINYEVPVATTNYNHIIRVVSSPNVTAYKNNITGKLPLKRVDFNQVFPSIYTDQVAGVAVQSSNGFNFTGNNMDIVGNNRLGDYPTLDALIIVQSYNSYINGNTINLRDNVSGLEDTNYLYAVDVYECDNITIDGNVITINSDGGNLTVNGTGAAYGVQLTGPHVGIVISNNNITTANNGPNLGIYSQNYYGDTSLTIYGNRINVTGRAGDHPWALVSGMELQDDYANVSGNIIHVNNVAGYDSTYCAYGISYSQTTYTGRDHVFVVYNNTVVVENGTYAVYLDGADNSLVYENCLDTTAYCCDNAVYLPGETNDYYDNYCNNCPNCPNCPDCNS